MWEPFGRPPLNSTGQWKEGPKERGTFGILSSCIFTLILCIYSCLHLNIPIPSRATWLHRTRQRIWWVVVGLFAPEVIAFIALRDWHAARRLDDEMARLLPAEPAQKNYSLIETPTLRRHRWTRTHSHFALMGGYAVEFGGLLSLYDRRDPDKVRRMLRPTAIRKIVQNAPELLPDVSQQLILDKSKASGLGKFLACLQAFWFLIQVIGRLANGLPISLLELNVLLHAVCCLCIYVAWWNKPFDIEEPLLLNGSDRLQQVCAWLMLEENPVRSHPCRNYSSREWQLSYIGDSHSPDYAAPVNRESKYGSLYSFQARRVDADIEQLQHRLGQSNEYMQVRLFGDQICYGFTPKPVSSYSYHDDPTWTKYKSKDAWLELKSDEIFRLKLAHCLISNEPEWTFSYGRAPAMFVDQTIFMSSPDDAFQGWDGIYTTGLMLAGTVYGGLHLVAWNGPFTSTSEQWLWRYACIIIASPGPLALIYRLHPVANMIYEDIVKPCCERLRDWIGDCAALCIQAVCVFFVCITVAMAVTAYVLMYISARLYLITECFTTLAHLPPEVYVEPSWSRYLPHWGAG